MTTSKEYISRRSLKHNLCLSATLQQLPSLSFNFLSLKRFQGCIPRCMDPPTCTYSIGQHTNYCYGIIMMQHINSFEILNIQVVTLTSSWLLFSQDNAIHKSQIFRLDVEIGVSGEFQKCLGVSSWQLGVQVLLEKTLNA